MTQKQEAKQTPPYVTYSTFKRFINQLAGSLVPDQIDDHALSKFSGSEKAALLPALKFLDVMDDSKAPTKRLRELVEASRGERWQATLSTLLADRYKGITDGIDMERGTGTQLDKAFRELEISSSVWPKCARFYLQAVEDTGVTISPYIKTKRRNSPKKRTATKKVSPKASDGAVEGGELPKTTPLRMRVADDEEAPEGFERLPIPGVKGGFIQYPEDLTSAGCTMFETMVSTLRKLVEVKREEGGPS